MYIPHLTFNSKQFTFPRFLQALSGGFIYDVDPYYFDHRLTQARINDFQRTIGEARWGFYRK